MAWRTPKTDWNNGDLVSADDMNAIGENLAALKRPSAAFAVGVTTADITANAGDFRDVDSDNLNLTITTTGGQVLVHFHGSVWRAHREGGYYDIEVDGTRQGDTYGILRTYAKDGGGYDNLGFTHLIQNLGAGPHTFKFQWKIVNSLQLKAGAQFWVREI